MKNFVTHKSVLLTEVTRFLDVKPGKRYIDSTVGGGGHLEAILIKGGEVLGIDQDPKSLDIAEARLNACPGTFGNTRTLGGFKLILSNFTHLQEIAQREGFVGVDGIIFDLGFASFQMDDPERGLSFSNSGPLDMRLDPALGVKARDLVNFLSEKELERLFRELGEEPFARRIAQKIVQERSIKQIDTTHDLRSVVESVTHTKKGSIHPATRIFMALRIAVNTEFENLIQVLPQALELLKENGRLVIISFHSGEDRIVKRFFQESEKSGFGCILTEKPIKPTKEEISNNPRARSGLLRVFEKKNVKEFS